MNIINQYLNAGDLAAAKENANRAADQYAMLLNPRVQRRYCWQNRFAALQFPVKGVKNIYDFNTPKDTYSTLVGVHLASDKAKTDAVSPVHFVSKDNPPFLIMHGTKEALVPFAQSVNSKRLLSSQAYPFSFNASPAACTVARW